MAVCLQQGTMENQCGETCNQEKSLVQVLQFGFQVFRLQDLPLEKAFLLVMLQIGLHGWARGSFGVFVMFYSTASTKPLRYSPSGW